MFNVLSTKYKILYNQNLIVYWLDPWYECVRAFPIEPDIPSLCVMMMMIMMTRTITTSSVFLVCPERKAYMPNRLEKKKNCD